MIQRIRYTPKAKQTPFEGITRDPTFYQSRIWRKARAAHITSSPLCVVCGRAGQVVDHIKPINPVNAYDTQGGTYGDPLAESNMQTMCHKCHNAKSGRSKHKQETK